MCARDTSGARAGQHMRMTRCLHLHLRPMSTAEADCSQQGNGRSAATVHRNVTTVVPSHQAQISLAHCFRSKFHADSARKSRTPNQRGGRLARALPETFSSSPLPTRIARDVWRRAAGSADISGYLAKLVYPPILFQNHPSMLTAGGAKSSRSLRRRDASPHSEPFLGCGIASALVGIRRLHEVAVAASWERHLCKSPASAEGVETEAERCAFQPPLRRLFGLQLEDRNRIVAMAAHTSGHPIHGFPLRLRR